MHDPALRENFLERAFTMRRFERLLDEQPTVDGLLRFHADHKLAVMAHSPSGRDRARATAGEPARAARGPRWSRLRGGIGRARRVLVT